ncbi:hypothetical protein AKJ16_DCAP21405, partial [Drosera capensis]
PTYLWSPYAPIVVYHLDCRGDADDACLTDVVLLEDRRK